MQQPFFLPYALRKERKTFTILNVEKGGKERKKKSDLNFHNVPLEKQVK